MTIIKDDKELLLGTRDRKTGLWRVPILKEEPEVAKCNNLQSTNISEYIAYIHATLFSPTTSTWIKAIKAGFFNNLPQVTINNVYFFLPKSESTVQGHLDQQRKSTKSTKEKTKNKTKKRRKMS